MGSTQPLTDMSTRNLPESKKRPVCRADNLAAICEPMSENMGAFPSRNPKGLNGLYRDSFTFTSCLNLTRIIYECCQPDRYKLFQ
jgi:hypothetical protein